MRASPASNLVLFDGPVPELAPNVEATTIADACREAGPAFLEGARGGWGKLELAAWLVGSYRPICAPMAEDASGILLVLPSGTAHAPIRAGAVEGLIELVAVAATSALAELARGETAPIAEAMRDRAIASAQGPRSLVWVPADRPRLRLEARLMSLFAVDYLLRSDAYTTDLLVCGACDEVNFDGAERACARCQDRGRPSHIRETGGGDAAAEVAGEGNETDAPVRTA